jgi:signal transduction histidine kinase
LFLLVFAAQGGHCQKIDDLLKKAFLSQDSSAFYFKKAKKAISGKRDLAEYYFCKNAWHTDMGGADSAIYYGRLAERNFIALKDNNKLMYVYNNLGKIYSPRGEYDKAVSVYLKGLKVAEIEKSDQFKCNFYHNISIAYHDFEDFRKGVIYGKKNYEAAIKAKERDPLLIAGALNAIAINYDDMGKADSALYYHYKVFDHVKGRDTIYLMSTYNNIGNTLLKQKKYAAARKWILSAIKLTEAEKNNLLQDRYNYELATNYTNLATIAYNLNDFTTAEKYFDLAHNAAIKSNNVEKKRDYFYHQYLFNKKRNNIGKAFAFQDEYLKLRDSVFDVDKAKAVADLEAKYQNEKKQKELQTSKAEIALNQQELQRKNTQFIILSLISIALLVIAYLIYRQQKMKNRQLAQEHDLKTAIAHIETQNKLQDQRLTISRDLHDNIGAQLTFIISSVDNTRYAFDMDNTGLGNKLQNISNFAKDTIVELRDTIWAMNSHEITIEDLRGRIANFIEKAIVAQSKTSFIFNIDESILATRLSSVQGMNLYRTIQEAVNNALKYSGATEITLDISRHKDAIAILIADNGYGFNPEAVTMGSGIGNMKKRIADIGGDFSISAAAGNGTKVSITINKPSA